MSDKISYKISKIKAISITHPKTDSDEVYAAVFASTAKSSTEDGKVAYVKKFVDKKLSDIKTKVWPGTSWVPQNLSGEVPFDKDAEFVFLTIALYEADDTEIYKKILTKIEEPPSTESFEWDKLSIPSDPKSPLEWLTAIWKLVSSVYSYLKQDDSFYFYNEGIRIADTPSGSKWEKKIMFQRYGGEYQLTLELERPK